MTYMLAFEALGFGTGAAVDAAELVAWCDICGLGGAARLAERLPALEEEPTSGPPHATEEPGGQCLDASGASLLWLGAAAVEHGHAEHMAGRIERLTLRHVKDLEFAPGLAVLAARRGIDVVLSCRGRDTEMTAMCDGATGEVELRLADAAPGAEADELVAVFGGGRDPWREADAGGGTREIASDQLRAAAEASLIDGIPIEAGIWAAILRAAKNRLVPESEQSRERGAGIGADDED